MSVDPEFTELMEQVRQGSADAAARLLREHGHLVMTVVRRRLHRRLRSKFDSVDFTQAIWASFFVRAAKERRFDTPAHLMAFLAQVAQNKLAAEHRRRFRTAKYQLGREVAIDSTFGDQVPAPDSTPSQLAIAKETLEQLLAGQPAHYRPIVELKMAGLTAAEIAARRGIHERTVRRVLKQLRMPEDD